MGFISRLLFGSRKCPWLPMLNATHRPSSYFMCVSRDILLLEAGFLCVLVSPLRYKPLPRRRPPPQAPHEPLTFWLVRWLLFRLMFSSGIVKLTSGCPQWWGLTGELSALFLVFNGWFKSQKKLDADSWRGLNLT